MKRDMWFIACTLCIIAPVYVDSISVVAPRMFRPYSKYHVALTSESTTGNIYVAIEGNKDNGEAYSTGQEISVYPGTSRLLELRIGDPGPGTYNLVAKSLSGDPFSSTSPVTYLARTFCVFVQTDKRVYQPKDTIQFRVITLSKNLLPVNELINVTVLDSGSSAVRQWLQVPLENGIFASQLTLADQPGLGEWTFQVEILGQTYNEMILIADYVQPKFNLNINVPKHVLFSEDRFLVNVTARHFNGLPVKGELTLAVYPVFFSEIVQPVVGNPTRKVIFIDGQATVEFSTRNDLSIAEDSARPVVVEAILEEDQTLRRQNVSTRLLLLRLPYRLNVHAPEFFKANLPYKIQLEVIDTEGKPYTQGDSQITVERVWDDGAPSNITMVTLNNGVALYTYTPDTAHNRSTLNFLIRYMDIKERLVNIKSAYTLNGQHIEADVMSRDIKVDDKISVRVLTSEAVTLLNYAFIGRGDILTVQTKEQVPARSSFDIETVASSAMAPGVVVLFWYESNGEIISTSIYLPVHGMFTNKVSLQVSPADGRPDTPVEISMEGEGNSHGSIIVSDMTTRCNRLNNEAGLGAGLDIYKVEREVESFSGISYSIFKNIEKQPGLGTIIGESNTADTFQKSGLVILTSAKVASKNPGERHPPIPPIETGTRPPLTGPYAFTRLPPPPSPSYYLNTKSQNTWIFANITSGANGRGQLSRKSPLSPGTYIIGGFAIHPELGLGFAEPKIYRSSQLLTIEADVPSTLQIGEAVTVIVTLRSTLTADIDVEVTLHNSQQFFEFEPLDNDVSPRKIELYRRENVRVPAGGVKSTAFLISTVKQGDAELILQAQGGGVQASHFKTISIQSGESEEVKVWGLLDARRNRARTNITLNPPLGSKVGTVYLLAAGDVLAPLISSLKRLPELGSDAQQAVKPLAFGCLLLDYLERTEQPAIMSDARQLLESGLQRVMNYRTKHNAFSTDAGSQVPDVLMTASVGNWLTRCSRWLPISDEMSTSSLSWLISAQNPNGSWTSNSTIAPHLNREVALTALATISLASSITKAPNPLYKNTINKATNYLVGQLPTLDDPFQLSLVARALSAVQHPDSQMPFQRLEAYSVTNASTRHWRVKTPPTEERSPWISGRTIEIETAAHALHALLTTRLYDDVLAVVSWLLSVGDSTNIYKVEALAAFAEKSVTDNKLQLTAILQDNTTKQFNIDNGNSLIIQEQIVKNSRNASVSTEGRGMGIVGLSGTVSLTATSPWPRYTLDPRVDAVSTSALLQLSICAGFVQIANESLSGLTKMYIHLPSGFKADLDTVTGMEASTHVRSANLIEDGSGVVAWLQPQGNREYCTTLRAARAYRVARQKPGWVTMMDCYDNSHRARVFFRAKQSTLCDICPDFESCSSACGSASYQTADGKATPNNVNVNSINTAHTIVAVNALAAILISISIVLAV